MQTFNFKSAPIKVYGAPLFEATSTFERFPKELLQYFKVISNNACDLRRRCAGARVCFKTDSPTVTVTVKIEKLELDIGMSLFSGDAVAMITGSRQNSDIEVLFTPRTTSRPNIPAPFIKNLVWKMLCFVCPATVT